MQRKLKTTNDVTEESPVLQCCILHTLACMGFNLPRKTFNGLPSRTCTP